MASNPPPHPSGYGRGGRGAALLAALQKPQRKPGDPPSPPGQPAGTAGHAEPGAPRVMPLGRGVLGEAPFQIPQGLGRGMVPAAVGPLGRGGGLPLGLGRGVPLGRGQLTPSATPTPSVASSGTPSPAHTPLPSLGPNVPGSQPSSQPPSPPRPTQQPSSGGDRPGPSGDHRMTWMERMSALTIEDTVRKTGSYGDTVRLCSNHIPIKCKTGGTYQYAVSFSPQVDSRGMRYRLLYSVLQNTSKVRAFDGCVLFLPNKLPDNETVYDTVRPTDGSAVRVIIKFVKLIPPGSSCQLYNIIFKNIMKILRYSQVGRNYYNSHEPSQIPQYKLEIWPGYVTSIEEYEGGRLLLMTDVTHRMLRTETVYSLINDIKQKIEKKNEQNQLKKQDIHSKVKDQQDLQTEFARAVIGQSVLTRYNNRTYRIDDIDWTQNPESTFQKGNDTISYRDYYRQNYNKFIEDPLQPILLHVPKKRERRAGAPEVIALIPELCHLTGLSDELRSSYSVMKDVHSHTRLTPSQRNISMLKFCESLNNSPEATKELESWGLEIDRQILQLQGREFMPEKVTWGRGSKQSAGPRADFGRQIGREAVLTPVDLHTWLLIAYRRDQQIVDRFYHMLISEAGKMSMSIGHAKVVYVQDHATNYYLSEIRKHFTPNRTQMIMTICPTSRDDRYNAIKKLCYVEMPVPSQVINTTTIRNDKKLRSVCQKVALQMNAKLGGELWAVDIPGKGLMVCGIDVFHGGTNSKLPSQMGFVASLNQSCTRWFSTCARHMSREEIADGLRVCLTRALMRYHTENHTFPDRIILFRDGVGDGQLATVAGFEVPQLQDVFPQMGSSYCPKLAVIVVQKRINQRIFSCNRGNLENPKPGTVVDHTITRKNWYDFFLVSQHVGQGTVSPTHYVVVHDQSGWDSDKLQRLSYKLTHMYYNWPGTIRVPAPCQYAHKLAYMVGQNLSGKVPAEEMSDRLFYL